MKKIVSISVLHRDEYYEAKAWPQEGDKVEVRYQGSTSGGSVANFSFVCAAFGAPVCFFDTMSDSEVSDKLLKEMEEAGIDTSMVNRLPGLEDPKCIIIRTPQERTILSDRKERPPLPLTEKQRTLLEEAGVIYTQMGRQRLIVDPLQNFRRFQKKGALIALDIEEYFPNAADREFMENADLLFFNQFGFAQNRGGQSEQAYVDHLLACGVKIIVLTRGEKGCRIYTRDQYLEMEAYELEVLDPNGAGDTFNASFIYGLLNNWSLEKTTRFAIAASNYAITQAGPRGGAVPILVVEDFMNRHGHYL